MLITEFQFVILCNAKLIRPILVFDDSSPLCSYNRSLAHSLCSIMIKDIIGYLLIIFSYHISSVLTFSSNSFSNSSVDIFEDSFEVYDNNTIIDFKFDNDFVKFYRLSDGEIITKLKLINFKAIETKFADLCLRQVSY